MSRLMMVVLCGVVGVSSAAVIYVDGASGNDSWAGTAAQPKRSIGAAISAAANLDEIVVRAGTYTGASNRDLQPGTKNIVIRSESGAGVTIIDAEGAGRVFKISAAPATAKIKGFTIQNGMTDTMQQYGGGGGGVYLLQTAMTIEDCVIKNCSGPEGAGMLIRNSVGTRIVNCTFQNNIGTHTSMVCRAAGVSIFMSSDVEFQGCQFISNRVEPTGNSGNGGAIYLWRDTARFKNCIFEGNFAKTCGGVAYIEEGGLTFDQCTFAGNRCGGNGGCFFVGYMGVPHEAVCTNSIFWNNTAGDKGPVAFVNCMGPAAGGAFRYGYCNINAAAVCMGNPGGAVLQNLGGNINADPLFVSMGRWDAASSSWISGDYHLQSMLGRLDGLTGQWVVDAADSPCLDTGDPAADCSAEPATNGGRVNMGAYGASAQASKSPGGEAPVVTDSSGGNQDTGTGSGTTGTTEKEKTITVEKSRKAAEEKKPVLAPQEPRTRRIPIKKPPVTDDNKTDETK